jgi:hypothetical protein
MSIKSKISKIERDIKKSNGGFVHIEVIHLWKKNWRELEQVAKREHMEKHGTLSNLMIVRTVMPLPAPPPTDEELALIHGTNEQNDDSDA